MAITVQTSPLAKHLMLLSMLAGLLLLFVGPVHHWRQMMQLSGQAHPAKPSSTQPTDSSPRARDTKLVVHLGDRHVRVYRHGQEISRYPVAVGKSGWETPNGRFKIHQMRLHPQWRHPITNQVVPAGPNNPLGDRWIGFYEGEHMALGFHGTPQESLVGTAVSHGCLRMRNRDIQTMYKQVGLGTVIEVRR